MENERSNDIMSTADLVTYYGDKDLHGQIKVYFRRSDVKTHTSKLDKPYYIVKPLVVKVGDEFDDHIKYGLFLKPKHHYRMNLIDADMWLMSIDDQPKTFKNDEGNDVSFFDVSLKYITNSKLIDTICKKALSNSNIEEFNDDEL